MIFNLTICINHAERVKICTNIFFDQLVCNFWEHTMAESVPCGARCDENYNNGMRKSARLCRLLHDVKILYMVRKRITFRFAHQLENEKYNLHPIETMRLSPGERGSSHFGCSVDSQCTDCAVI